MRNEFLERSLKAVEKEYQEQMIRSDCLEKEKESTLQLLE